MTTPAEETDDGLFGDFGDEVRRELHDSATKFADILRNMSTPGLLTTIDLTVVDSAKKLKQRKSETSVRCTRSKRKNIPDDDSSVVESPHSSSDSPIRNHKNKKKTSKPDPVILNSVPIEINESDHQETSPLAPVILNSEPIEINESGDKETSKLAPVILNSEPIEINESDDEKVVAVNDEESPLKEELFNPEVSVKVIWKSVNNHRFKMRKYQKMQYMFDYFNKVEGIDQNKLFFVVHGKMVYPDDTPESLELSIIDFIDGGEVRTPIDYYEPRSPKKLKDDSIEFKILVEGEKKPIFMRIKKTEPMIILKIKVAERLDLPLNSLKFSFDGERLKDRDTVTLLDMEGGECIEVTFGD